MSVGYLGTPNDIAGLVSYIASEESHFITGMHSKIMLARYPY
jgi:NAD(P)-dependent dehydrogenase (short-subunit alcohol dehydrogenase family)